MSTDTALIEKREELKRRLAAGEYKTLVDIFLEWFDRLLRKITRRSELLPIWYTTVILYLVVNLIGFTAVYVAGEAIIFRKFVELSRLRFGISVSYFISANLLPIVGAVVMNQYINNIGVFWRDNILDVTQSPANLDDFENWLGKVCNHRLNLLVIIIGGSLGGLYLIAQTRQLNYSSYGFALWTIIINLFNWSIIYQLIMVILLSTRLRRYDLNLFEADPASSACISRLSSEFGFVVYFVAVLAAIFTLIFALVGLLPFLGNSVVIFYWVPLVGLFILNQTSLSSVIRRVKWKTLNAIQAKVAKLQAVENFENKETMEAINRLLDYHDRIKATRNSAIDLGAILGLINSLLLPLLAFLLGNLDSIMKLFGVKP